MPHWRHTWGTWSYGTRIIATPNMNTSWTEELIRVRRCAYCGRRAIRRIDGIQYVIQNRFELVAS